MLRNKKLQELCREYLSKLNDLANKYGLGEWLSNLIAANKRGECEGTEAEVELLARCVDDNRIARIDIPAILGKSYRQCFNANVFDRIKNLGWAGTYSKVSTLLYAAEQECEEKDNGERLER